MSRDLSDLLLPVALKAREFIGACKVTGIDLLVTCTYRTMEEQAALYAQGRTAPGRIVTNAKPGQSYHNWRVALDVVPLRDGKPVWGTTGHDLDLWERVGAYGKATGFEWAGDFVHMREYPHFQYTGGLTYADFANGKTLPN